MEWGQDQSSFVFEAALEVFAKQDGQMNSFLHPLVLAPFVGQLLIMFAFFQKQPKRLLLLAGIVLMGALVVMVLLAGSLSMNAKMVFSTLPFIASAVWSIQLIRRPLQAV